VPFEPSSLIRGGAKFTVDPGSNDNTDIDTDNTHATNTALVNFFILNSIG
jgi:hypothetical protein